MKKIMILLVTVGMFGFQGCTVEEPTNDNDTINEVFDVTGVNFTSANDFSTLIDLNPSILNYDMVLLYRKALASNGQFVWKLVPETYYFDDGTLYFAYNYNFTVNDISIYMDGNFADLGSVSTLNRLNQTFRVVILPGSSSGSAKLSSAKSVAKDYSDYNAVIKKYKIDDSNVKQINK